MISIFKLGFVAVVFLRASGYLSGFLIRYQSWESLVNQIGEERESFQNHEGCRELSLKHSKRAFYLTAAWFSMVSFGHISINCLCAFIEVNKFHLPINFYITLFPVDGFTLNWTINYFYQVLTSTFGAFSLLVSLPLMMFTIDHACWELDIAVLLFEDLNDVPLENSLLRKMTLKNILDLTRGILKTQRDVQSLIGFNFFMEFSLMGMIICMSLFTFISDSMDAGPSLMTFIISLIQLSIYCFMGNRVIVRIDKLRETVYDTSWYLFELSQQKEIQMIVTVYQYMKGFNGIFNPIGLETFRKVSLFIYGIEAHVSKIFRSEGRGVFLFDGSVITHKRKVDV